ncbi:hypothetical protein MJD09_21380 [bacterium]|nr:hypothetical protein [bacterium]
MINKQKSIIEQDIVLIHVEEKPAFYARVEAITADVKPKWWQVKFLFLTMPVQVVTWIIDDEQIRGADFTMGGTPIRIERIEVPKEAEAPTETPEESSAQKKEVEKKGRVLSLHRKN